MGLLGHTEQATPVGAPISTPAEPCTISSPLRVMSPCRAAGFPLMVYSFSFTLHGHTNSYLYCL
ncbi:TPA: hypothetical protein HH707_005038 [Escherichia coli]|nr:hypothetical protein [Escherichia coli]